MAIHSCTNCSNFFAPMKCCDCGQVDKLYCVSCHNRQHRFDMRYQYLGRYDKEKV